MIKVCIPYYSEWEEPKAGLADLTKAGIAYEYQTAQGPYVAQARNALINGESSQLIKQDVGTKFTHYLFVDSDIGFTADHVISLLTLNERVACCPYLRHGSKTQYQVGLFAEPGLVKERFTTKEKGIKRVEWCGGGFLLVKAEVFNKLAYPWFRYGIFEKDGKAEILGEDFMFSMALAKAGITIWCNLDRPVYHRNRIAEYKT